MENTANVFQSSQERQIALRMRKDLTVVPQVYRNEQFWLIKDPLEMEFYRLNEEEYSVLQLLDGRTNLDDIKSEFERQFSPQRITHRQLQTFVSDLRKKSLLAFEEPDVGPYVAERETEKRLEKVKKQLVSVLSLKWRGVDPDRLLEFLTPKLGWVFSQPVVTASCLFMISALAWFLVNYDQFVARMPGLEAFLAQENWLLLGAVIVVMKIMHELAHGIAFKRFGGECHEIGIMLLVVVIPTLYCSTTDSWLLKDKWKRAAIGAAGMYIELLIAALATFTWWYTEPGTLNMLCLNLMVTGTVSVIVMNANPFFKFDGYYIFSDIFELPNLRERAGRQTQSTFLKYGLGIDEQSEPNSLTSTKIWLVTYKLLAFVFKLAVIVLIKFMLIDKLNAIGLGYIGLTIGLIAIGALLVPPMWSLYKFFKVPGRFHRIEMKNLLITLAIVAVSALALFAIPFPHHVTCPFTIQPRDGQSIYVQHDALLKEVLVEPGQRIAAGEIIVLLQNLDDALELEKIETEQRELKAELQLLEETREASSSIAAKISAIRQSIRTNADKIAELIAIVDSFEVVALRDGQVIPERNGSSTSGNALELGTYTGSALSQENVGTWLRAGDKICVIGELTEYDAVLAVNEHDVSFIVPGQPVTLMLDSLAGVRFPGEIGSIARKETDQLPSSLAKDNGGTIQIAPATKTVESPTRPSDQHFEARVLVPDLEVNLSSGLRGQARIRVGSKTAFQRLRLLTYRSFRKKLN